MKAFPSCDIWNPLSHSGWNYAVLALSAVFDFYSWRVSYRKLLADRDENESTWDEIVGSKDPTTFTVFVEDSAGLIGVTLAFLGIFLGHLLHNPYLDPIASILIGLLLSAVALILGRESGALLIGERTNRARVRHIGQILKNDPLVEAVGDVLTMQLGPDHVLLTANVRFQRDLRVEQLEVAIALLETEIRRQEPMIDRIFIEVSPRSTSRGTSPSRIQSSDPVNQSL